MRRRIALFGHQPAPRCDLVAQHWIVAGWAASTRTALIGTVLNRNGACNVRLCLLAQPGVLICALLTASLAPLERRRVNQAAVSRISRSNAIWDGSCCEVYKRVIAHYRCRGRLLKKIRLGGLRQHLACECYEWLFSGRELQVRNLLRRNPINA
jgi:hypothetical protein